MVKIENEHALQLSAALTGAYGVHFLASPSNAHDTYMTATEPFSKATSRWFGFGLVESALAQAIASRADPSTQKKMLKGMAITHAAAAAHNAWNVRKNHQKESSGWANTAVIGGLAAVLAWKGFSNNGK